MATCISNPIALTVRSHGDRRTFGIHGPTSLMYLLSGKRKALYLTIRYRAIITPEVGPRSGGGGQEKKKNTTQYLLKG